MTNYYGLQAYNLISILAGGNYSKFTPSVFYQCRNLILLFNFLMCVQFIIGRTLIAKLSPMSH